MTQEKLDAEIRRWEQRMEEAKDRIRVLKAEKRRLQDQKLVEMIRRRGLSNEEIRAMLSGKEDEYE